MSAAKRKVGRAEDALGVIKIPVKLQAPEVDIAKVKDSHKNAGWYPRQESNLHLSFRRALFYPLNYGDNTGTNTPLHEAFNERGGKDMDILIPGAISRGRSPYKAFVHCLTLGYQSE